MASIIYIISNPYVGIELYKVGIHSDTKRKLESRYGTYIPQKNIHYIIETNNARKIETLFKQRFEDKRMTNDHGRSSEWFKLSLSVIIANILDIMKMMGEREIFRVKHGGTIHINVKEYISVNVNRVNIVRSFIKDKCRKTTNGEITVEDFGLKLLFYSRKSGEEIRWDEIKGLMDQLGYQRFKTSDARPCYRGLELC